MNIKSEDIELVLSNVEPNQYFITKTGKEIKSIQELPEHLQQMDEETFKHHVNEQKNDFSNWIQDVIKDKELAEEIKTEKNKAEAAKKVEAKVKRLKKIKEHLKTIEEHEKNAYSELQKTATVNTPRNPIRDYAYGVIIGTIAGLILGSIF
jgi:hypothetical protein